MGIGIQVATIAVLDGSQLILIWEARQVGGILGTACILVIDAVPVLFQLLARLPHDPGITEKILCPQEEALASPLAPAETEILCQFPDRSQGFVSPYTFTSDCNGLRRTS